MKNRFFLLLAIIGLVTTGIILDYPSVLAQQQVPGAVEKEGKYIIPAEFTPFGDVNEAGVATAEQTLYTQQPDRPGHPPIGAYPRNGFNFGGAGEVDALANGQDVLFWDLINNTAELLISVANDTKGVWCVWQEARGGRRDPKWKKTDLDADGVTLPQSKDLDALEVWGDTAFADSCDANYYSLQGDPNNISVKIKGAGGPYISRAEIFTAVHGLGFTGTVDSVDLDGLMVWDTGGLNGSPDALWNSGDAIIFSIRKAANWDGGEIVVMQWAVAQASFLNHGRHLWNTGFDVTLFGVDNEEVDAVEAFAGGPHTQTPTLTQWGLVILVALLIASTVFVLLKRRKAAVPA